MIFPNGYQQQTVQQGQLFMTQAQCYQQVLQQMAFPTQPNTMLMAPQRIQILPAPTPPATQRNRQVIPQVAPKKAFESQQLGDSQLLFLPTGGCVRLPNCPSEASGTVDSLVLDLALPTLNFKHGTDTTQRRIRKFVQPVKHIPIYPVATPEITTGVPLIQMYPGTQFI